MIAENKFKNKIYEKTNKNNSTIFENDEEELIKIQNYIYNVFNDTKIDSDKIYYPSNNPKISVVISVYNGEGYLKKALLSIQNQDFKDIEIIIIDDCSVDNSVILIKNLMISEPRIVLYQNDINKGMLYTKSKGILLAKGKYILLLDEDDIYVQRDAFSTLFKEAEENNLDILNFREIVSKPKLKKINYKKKKTDSSIIFQPELGEKMFKHTPNGQIRKYGGTLPTYFIKRNNINY